MIVWQKPAKLTSKLTFCILTSNIVLLVKDLKGHQMTLMLS